MKIFTTNILIFFLALLTGVICCKPANGQQNPLIASVTAPCAQAGHPPSNVLDGNSQTCFVVHPYGSCGSNPNMELNMQLTKSVKALQVTITAGVSGISVSPGNTTNYHRTMENTETFYIIKPAGFSSINFFKQGWGSICKIELYELDLDAVSLPFDYDNAGNMIYRTILLGSAKSGETAAPPTSEWDAASELELEESVELFADGTVVVYPNPTRGELRLETRLNETGLIDGQLSVYSLTGIQILHKSFDSSSATISLADQPSGVYILILEVNGKTLRWNIIKE